MAINEVQFSQKTEAEIKNYEILKSIFNKTYDIENELLNKRKSTFDDINKIQESDNPTLGEIYTNFTSEMKKLEEFRNNQMIKIKSKLIPATIYYSSKAKTYKQQIGKYKNKVKENEKQIQEMDKARMNQNQLKQSQLDEDIRKSKSQIKDEGKSLQNNVMDFEVNRIVDNQLIILHFIHCELAYHAKSLETLSDLYKKITYLEPKRHLKEFADKYQFQNVNLDEFGYDERDYTKNSFNPMKSSLNTNLKESKNKSVKKSGMLKKSSKEEYDDDMEEINDEEGEI